MKIFFIGITCLLVVSGISCGTEGIRLGDQSSNIRVNLVKTDDRAVELVNDFMNALLLEDKEASAQAVVPYLHKSLLKDSGELKAKESFYSAHSRAKKHYTVPVVITETEKQSKTRVESGGEEGVFWRYYLHEEGEAPKWIEIFFPKDTGEPIITDFSFL